MTYILKLVLNLLYNILSANTHTFCLEGLGKDTAQWLVDNRQVHGVGIDTASMDVGQIRRVPAHRVLFKKNIFILENINTNGLDLTDVTRPFLFVSPLKITSGSGSPVRPLLFTELPFPNYTNGGQLPSLKCLMVLTEFIMLLIVKVL